MRFSRRVKFADPQWRRWLEDFPDYSERGHVPGLRYELAVNAAIASAAVLPPPNDDDFKTLSTQLTNHFSNIRADVASDVNGGILSTITGLFGIAGDLFVLPGFSYALNSISGLLIIGGGAAGYSKHQEVQALKKARKAVQHWLLTL